MNSATRLAAAITLAFTALAARADVAAQWTAIAENSVNVAREAPPASQRKLAVAKEAIQAARDATRATGNGNGNGHGGAAEHERADAAVAVAAFAVLEALYPDQRETLEARLAITFSHIPETDAKAEGAAIGRRVATDAIRTTSQ